MWCRRVLAPAPTTPIRIVSGMLLPPSFAIGALVTARAGYAADRQWRPAGQSADFRFHVVRHGRAIGSQHHHLEALIQITLRELRARGMDTGDFLVPLASFENAIDCRNVFRLVIV